MMIFFTFHGLSMKMSILAIAKKVVVFSIINVHIWPKVGYDVR